MRAIFSAITLLAADVPDQFVDSVDRFNRLIYGAVLPITFVVLGALLGVFGVWRASKIAFADGEDTKLKAWKAMGNFIAGAAMIFIVAFVMPVLVSYLSSREMFPAPVASLLPMLSNIKNLAFSVF